MERGTIQYVEQLIEDQVYRGVPRELTRLTTNAQAASIVLELSSGNPADDVLKIAQYRQNYGADYFNKFMSELVGAGLDPLVPILDAVTMNDPASAVIAMQAVRTTPEDLKQKFNNISTVPYRELEVGVQDYFTDAFQAIAGYANSPERIAYARQLERLATRAAAMDAVMNGFDDVNESAEKWYNRIFGDHYEAEETYYLPRTDSQGQPYNTEAISGWANRTIRSPEAVRDLKISPTAIDNLDGVASAIRSGVTDELIADRGIWLNTADGKGLQLFIDTDFGLSQVLFEGTRDPYVLSLRDIERMSKSEDESRRQAIEKIRERQEEAVGIDPWRN